MLVGRERELATITDVIAAARSGAGAAVFLTGPAGIGKSALARAALKAADAQGVRTLVGRAVAHPSPVPFRPLAEAVLSTARHAGLPDYEELAPFRPALARLVPEWRRPGMHVADDSPVVLGEGIVRLLRLLCPNGCLLALDDLHWADLDTLAVVEYLCDNLGGEPISLLGTARTGERAEVGALIGALGARDAATQLELEALGAPAIRSMIQACSLPVTLSTDLAVEVAGAAEGVPLLVEELLGLAADPTSGTGRRVPGTVEEAVRRRLAGMDEPTRRVLGCSALLGRRFDWTLLETASGLDEHTVLAALRLAVDTALLDAEGGEFRFHHALIRDAVLDALLPPELTRMSGATLAAVQQAHPRLPGPWCALAADLAESAGDPQQAAALLVTAGRRALQQAALGSAEQLLGRALQLGVHAETRLDAGELLAEVLAASGRVDDATEVAESLHSVLAGAGSDGTRRARLELRLARAGVAAERWELAGAQLAQARPAAEQDPALSAELDALAAQLAIGTGDPTSAARLATAAVQAATAADRPEVACEALEVIGRAARLTSLTAARHAFEQASALAERHGLQLWQIRALHELGTVDLLGYGRVDRLEQARQRAVDSGALTTVAVLDVQLAAGHLIRGERQLGVLAGQRAHAAGLRFRIPAVAQSGLCFVASNKAMLLDRPGLETAAEELLAGGADAYLLASMWGDGRAVYALLTEDRRAAVRALEQARELLPQPAQAPSPWWGLWTLLRALDGRDAEQALHAAQWSGEAVWSAMQFGYTRAVLAGRNGDRAGAETTFQAADALAAAFPWRRHLCRRLVAEAALTDGWGEPLRWLGEAATFFDSFPAPAVASACHSLRRKAGAPARRPRPPSVPAALAELGVTEREAEVLDLVGRGLSNRELAQRLYLSPRTVEKHVENLARKLGIHSRSQLVAYAATSGRTTLSLPDLVDGSPQPASSSRSSKRRSS